MKNRFVRIYQLVKFGLFTLLGASAIASWYAEVNAIQFQPIENHLIELYRQFVGRAQKSLVWAWPDIPPWMIHICSIEIAMAMATKRGVWAKEKILRRDDFRKNDGCITKIVLIPFENLPYLVIWPMYVILLVLPCLFLIMSLATVPLVTVLSGESVYTIPGKYKNNLLRFRDEQKDGKGPWLIVMYQGISIGIAVFMLVLNSMIN